MKKLFIIISIFHFAFSILNSSAAVPLKWTVETSRLQPAVFDVVRGETLALEASFQSYGKPVATSNMTAFLCWQTNGMESAWWMTNACTAAALSGSPSNVCTAAALSGSPSNVASVLFTPEMDPGAHVIQGFLGLSDSTNQLPATSYQLPSLSYRAAFTLRFRHGPGASPNVIDKPPRILDLAHTVVVNPPWPTQADFAATTTVMRADLKTYIDGQITGAGLVTPTMTTNIASYVIREDVRTNYLCTVAAAQSSYMPKTDSDSFKTVIASYAGADPEIWIPVLNPLMTKASVDSELIHYAKSNNPEFCNGFRVTSGYAKIHSWGYFGIEGQNLPEYINTLQWRTTNNHNVSDYGINNVYTKTESDSRFVPRSIKINGQTLSNDVTIAAGVTSVNSKTGDVTLVASDIGAYPATSGNQLASQVATQGAHLNAEDAQFVATNYDSVVNLPEAYVRIKLQHGGTNVWRTIWEEMRRWNAFCGVSFDWQTWGGFHTWSTNILAMIEETSPKEYAFYDGTTGDVAPDGFFWISQPLIGICAGAGYQRYLDTGGAVWILESNGLAANIGGTTNGYFRISDEEGNTQFEIIKGDKQTVPATARSIRSEVVMGVTHWFCDYAVTNAIAPPVAKFCRNLGANPPVWIADTEASCPCNVTWTPGVNTYTLEFWPKSTEPTMFCKAEYDRGGETRIRQAVPTEIQYIILNGTKYGLVPKTVNGELVMGLTAGN